MLYRAQSRAHAFPPLRALALVALPGSDLPPPESELPQAITSILSLLVVVPSIGYRYTGPARQR